MSVRQRARDLVETYRRESGRYPVVVRMDTQTWEALQGMDWGRYGPFIRGVRVVHCRSLNNSGTNIVAEGRQRQGRAASLGVIGNDEREYQRRLNESRAHTAAFMHALLNPAFAANPPSFRNGR